MASSAPVTTSGVPVTTASAVAAQVGEHDTAKAGAGHEHGVLHAVAKVVHKVEHGVGELAHEAVDVFRSDNPQNEGPKDPKVEEAVALAKAHRLAMLDAVRQEATTAEEKA